tara:strand:- start:9855 stop:10070 length:216 start_codon:yes stop_codon:yes gene_type:complete
MAYQSALDADITFPPAWSPVGALRVVAHSPAAEMVSFAVGALLAIALLVNHPITLYRSINNYRNSTDEQDK